MSNRFPPIAINKFIWAKFAEEYPETAAGYQVVPFFPTYDNTAIGNSWDDKLYVVYDVIAKYRASAFYPIKSESTLYSLRGKIEDVFLWREFVIDMLDKMDDAAKDINEWLGENEPDNEVFFHEFTVYQSEYARAATKRAADSQFNLYAAELIISYKYHLA